MKLTRSIFIAVVAAPIFFGATFPVCAASNYHIAQTIKLGVSGRYDFLTLDPSTHTLYIAQGTKVVVFNTQKGVVTGTISGIVHAHGIVLSEDGKTAYISDGGAGLIRVIDRTTLVQTATVSVGTNPDAMLLEPTTGHLFVFNGKSKTLSIVDPNALDVIATVPLPGKPEFPVADGHGNVYDNIEDLHQLIKIDASKNELIDTWTLVGCESPTGQAIDVANNLTFSVCDNGRLIVTEIPGGTAIATVNIGEGPDATAFDPAQKLIFTSNGGAGTLSIVRQINSSRYELIQTVKTAPKGRTLAFNPLDGDIYIIAPDPSVVGPDATKPLILLKVSK